MKLKTLNALFNLFRFLETATELDVISRIIETPSTSELEQLYSRS